MTLKQNQLEKLIKSYDELHRDLEYRRKKFQLEAKEKNLQAVTRDTREMEKLVREIREEQNIEKAKALAEQVRFEREEAEKAVIHLEEQIYHSAPVSQFKKAKNGEIQPGDLVRMKSGGSSGTVESIDKTKAIVQMGPMRLTVKLRDL